MKTELNETELKSRLSNMAIYEVADLIQREWGSKVYFGARPYLDAMHSLQSVNDNFGLDSGRSIVTYFLANATTFRGPVARLVKAELNHRIK